MAVTANSNAGERHQPRHAALGHTARHHQQHVGARRQRQRESGGGKGEQGGEIHHAASLVPARSEEHTSELQSLMRISYAVFCLKKKKKNTNQAKITLKTKNQLRH